jgi:S-DNA-T family DNA segregation ATPase FtsK/SpoIIIE
VQHAVTIAPGLWSLPVGIAESDLGPATLELYEGEHALVTGPARSGKSTVLWTLADILRAAIGEIHIVGMGGRRSPLRDCPALDRYAGRPGEAPAMLAQLRTVRGPALLLIDDAESFDDGDAAIATLLTADLPSLHVVAAGHNDQLRKLYGHWTKTVARAKSGLLLRPNVDMDGDLLGTVLPRRSPVSMAVPGRGYIVVNGEARIVQVAQS